LLREDFTLFSQLTVTQVSEAVPRNLLISIRRIQIPRDNSGDYFHFHITWRMKLSALPISSLSNIGLKCWYDICINNNIWLGFYFYVKAYSHSVMSVFGIASKLTIFVSNGETRSWSSQLRKYIFMRRFNTVRKVRTTAICLHLLVLTRQDPTSTLLSDKIYSKILWEERH